MIIHRLANADGFTRRYPDGSRTATSDHLICVIYDGNWQYDDNLAYHTFTARDSDILVAEVDFGADTVTDLAGQNSSRHGITYGYASGDLTFEADKFGGQPNDGEFYITGSYIVTNGTITKYYYFHGQRVATRKEGVLYYIAGDNLGTTSVVLNADGTVRSEARHYPYGVERWRSGTLQTEYRFSGKRGDAGLSLYQMGARWYDPYLNRFVSPDSIIPQPGNPQSLNRFSYVLGNPLRYRDPTGHWEEEWEEQFEQEHGRPPTEQDWWDYQFSLQIENWIAALWDQTYGLRSLFWNAEVTTKLETSSGP